MIKRCWQWLYRLAAVLSAGMLLGEGCIGPNDLRQSVMGSVNSLIFRALEYGIESAVTTAIGPLPAAPV